MNVELTGEAKEGLVLTLQQYEDLAKAVVTTHARLEHVAKRLKKVEAQIAKLHKANMTITNTAANASLEARAGTTNNGGSGAGLSTSPSKALLGCVVCDAEFHFRWTDTHGVAVCAACGTPYRTLHYDGYKRVEKPPECLLLPEWIPVARRYHAETCGMVAPGGFDMGLLGDRNATYSGATRADADKWNAWLEEHAEDLPKPNDPAHVVGRDET
jgi:hypothetical protein